MLDRELLVATDFSELSRRALRLADQWVDALGGRITPMHAYESITSLDGFQFHGPERSVAGRLPVVREEIERTLAEFARRDVAPARLRDGLFVHGAPAESIVAASLRYDLVVLSSHGRAGLARFFLGSVAGKVIHLAPGPVLVVHDEPALLPLRRIVVPTDLSPNSASALPVALEIAAAAGAAVELVHVHRTAESGGPTPGPIEERLARLVQEHAASAQASIETIALASPGSVQDRLTEHLRQRPAGLVVMSAVGADPNEHHLLGSVPARVVRAVRVPVLLVTPEGLRGSKNEMVAR